MLRLVEELPLVPVQYFKKLVETDDLGEVRIQLGTDIFRLLGFLEQGQLAILTNDFAKKSQKTHPQEIEITEHRKREYLSRKRSGYCWRTRLGCGLHRWRESGKLGTSS